MTADGSVPDWFVPTPTALHLPNDDCVASQASTFPGKPILAGSRNSLAVARSGALYSWYGALFRFHLCVLTLFLCFASSPATLPATLPKPLH